FTSTHPAVMQQRIKEKNWEFTFDPTQKKLSFASRLLMFIERLTGWRAGEYKNYKLLR
ncbi:MAG: glycosyltransferase family 2 protein, partial [Bacteroidia bacterium]|nr:glycosyltransferase family 2 protein [Bacteroidia bacterium]